MGPRTAVPVRRCWPCKAVGHQSRAYPPHPATRQRSCKQTPRCCSLSHPFPRMCLHVQQTCCCSLPYPSHPLAALPAALPKPRACNLPPAVLSHCQRTLADCERCSRHFPSVRLLSGPCPPVLSALRAARRAGQLGPVSAPWTFELQLAASWPRPCCEAEGEWNTSRESGEITSPFLSAAGPVG